MNRTVVAIAGMLVAAPAWALLAGLVLLSTGLRAWAGAGVHGPWVTPDEVVYAELGRNLFDSGSLSILGGPTPFYSLVQPLLVGLPLSLGDAGTGYAIAKGIEAFVVSLAAVPVYLWTRRLAGAGPALLATVLTLALPGLAYAGLLMTEAAFLPVFVLATWACAATIARPTRLRQALLVGAVALAVLTRLQALVLLPALVTAVGVEAALGRRRARELLRLWPAVAALAALALGWWLWQGAGGYESAVESSYTTADAARSVLDHAAALLLAVGIVPAAAVGVLLVRAVRLREPDADVRAYLAVCASTCVWVVVQVGVFASQQAAGLLERNLLGLEPLLLVGLAVWLGRGARRPRLLVTSGIVLVLAVPIVRLPVDRLFTDIGIASAFVTIPPIRWVGADGRELAVLVTAAVALVLFALLPRRALPLLAAGVLAFLVASSLTVSSTVAERATAQTQQLLGPEERWVDRAAAGPVAYLYDGDPAWPSVWLHVYWNRSIDRVLDLPGTEVPGPLPQREAVPGRDGSLDAAARWVIASTALRLVGEPVARIEQTGLQEAGLVLWRLDAPARIDTWVTGVQANGDVYGNGRLLVYDCGPGRLELTLLAKQPGPVFVKRDGAVVQRIGFDAAGESWNGEIPSGREQADGSTCAFDVETAGVVGTTRFAFVRG